MAIPVKANQMGFYGTKLRYEGDVFDVEKEEELGSWMDRQDTAEPAAVSKAPKVKKSAEPAAVSDEVI